MPGLPNRSALRRIEDVLLTAIDLALRRRTFTVASAAALRAIPSMGASRTPSLPLDTLAVVSGAGLYRWTLESAAADDDSSVLAPTDAGPNGRWLKQQNPGDARNPLRLRGVDVVTLPSGGYLQHVALYEGERTPEELESRIYARRPCIVIRFLDRPKKRMSTNVGALSLCDFGFELLCIDWNARGNLTSSRGSTVPSEAALSPGAYAMAGDLEDLLDGTIGEALGEPGITFCRTGNLTVVDKIGGGRGRVILALELGVWATTGRTDPDAAMLTAIAAQMQDAVVRPPSVDVDPDNVIISGLDVSLGIGLARAPSDGAARMAGATVDVASAPLHAFAAWSDTYRDLAATGLFTYTAVPIGASAPPQSAGTLRVGMTITDTASVVSDVLLAPTLRDRGAPFQIAP